MLFQSHNQRLISEDELIVLLEDKRKKEKGYIKKNKYFAQETYSTFFGKTESRRLQRCCSSAGRTDKEEFLS